MNQIGELNRGTKIGRSLKKKNQSFPHWLSVFVNGLSGVRTSA